MAPLIGVIGSLQAMEAIKLLAHYGQPASGKNRHVRCDDLSVPRNEVNAQPRL